MGSELGDCRLLPPLAACLAPSGTVKASPQGENLQVRSCVGSVSLQQSELTLNLWEAAKGNRNSLCCFDNLLDSIDQQLDRGFSCLVLEFLSCGLWLLWGHGRQDWDC